MVPSDLPDGYLEVHTFSVDSAGNLYGGDNQYGPHAEVRPEAGRRPEAADPPTVGGALSACVPDSTLGAYTAPSCRFERRRSRSRCCWQPRAAMRTPTRGSRALTRSTTSSGWPLDDGSDRIAGDATVTFKLAAGVDEVLLDLTSAAAGKGMTVSAVSVGGRAVAFTHAADRLRMPLPAPARAAAKRSTSRVTYSGRPRQRTAADPEHPRRADDASARTGRTARGSGCR